ncbi:NAD-dependent succinate-semialdehyde dehydrogenase [Antarcticibacterium arcticum]|uniref:NAD-dependent succinate-semialdehyde dehydrogenase n=1 Tax=Antarcticibacterium arcticum TaxID=2585771 RepID=A0A5B8YJN8_9FLAO|nr:NAD-dependent succinate-semialdehyde dehydrogenase [Antarcticibacterium arcticum]QED37047.1 NAD-dependent succinate-semialdehyde dehydrogenase [Antarcticibacterium arcticum]
MITSTNPYTGEEFASVKEYSPAQIDKALETAHLGFESWKQIGIKERGQLLKNAARELKNNKKQYAETITREMGKPLSQSIAEIEKCAWVCEYYAENGEQHLENEVIETDAYKSYVSFEPLGIILAVMPWNYPFWQVFRFAAPALMAGNMAVLKHASNVMQSANNIQKVFENAGFPKGCFQNIPVSSDKVEDIIKDKRIKAVTLTGSTPAGRAIASVAGEHIKKSVLELGGSNALVIFEDANLEEAAKTCVQARYQNTGQSCIAGKRLLLQENIADKFLKIFTEKVKELKSGDPMDEETFVGVMAREDLAKDLEDQVNTSVAEGATIHLGGKRKGTWFEPTILTKVTPKMPVFAEETFGPVIGVTTFNSKRDAIDLVNSSQFGLGVSLFTEDLKSVEELIPKFEDGAVFINELVKSDPRLPFGGTKISGYGRELSVHGIREFVNKKTVFIKKF